MVSRLAVEHRYPGSRVRRAGPSAWIVEHNDVYRLLWNTTEVMTYTSVTDETKIVLTVMLSQDNWWIQAMQYRMAEHVKQMTSGVQLNFETHNKQHFIYINGKRHRYEDGMVIEFTKAIGTPITFTCSTPEIPRVKYKRKVMVSRW